MGEAPGGCSLKKKKRLDTLIVGGLYIDDFEWASKEHEEAGYVLVGFILDFDGYHWKAVYMKADQLEKTLKEGIFGA
jgi:hypothetical protein